MTSKYAPISILFGALCMSFAALLVRLIQNADGFQILFYRGFPQCIMVMIVACVIRRISIKDFFISIDKTDISLGLAMCIAFSFYIFALLNTSVASALFTSRCKEVHVVWRLGFGGSGSFFGCWVHVVRWVRLVFRLLWPLALAGSPGVGGRFFFQRRALRDKRLVLGPLPPLSRF